MGKNGYVYIVSNKYRTVFYIGVTSNLAVRSHQHKMRKGCWFTRKYNCTDLIYYECFDSIIPAIEREKELKRFRRKWKLELIRQMNPDMKDLYDEVEGYN